MIFLILADTFFIWSFSLQLPDIFKTTFPFLVLVANKADSADIIYILWRVHRFLMNMFALVVFRIIIC